MFNYVLNMCELSYKQSLGWEETNIPILQEKLTKNQIVTEWYRCGKYGAMDANVVDNECLCCHQVKAIAYFELLDVRYGDMSAATQWV